MQSNPQPIAHNQYRHLFVIICLVLFPWRLLALSEIRDTEIENVLSDFLRPIAEAAKIDTKRLRIRLIADDSFNAFVMGGSDIFVFSGLITAVDNPAEIQAVVAHEIGHIDLSHMVTMRVQQRNEMARMLIMTALGAGMAAFNPQAGIGMITGASGMGQQGMMAFSREEERAADEYAVKLMHEANVPLSALLSVFQKMQNSYRESRTNPHNISHPLTEERIRTIRLHIADAKDKAEPYERLTMIQAKLVGYMDTPMRIITLYPESDKSDAALYARAISRMRHGNFDLARTGASTLSRRNPSNPYFQELIGDIEFQSGNFNASVRAYEESLKHIRLAQGLDRQVAQTPQIELALARALAARGNDGDAERATTLARTALLAEHTPMAFLVLAKSDTVRHDYYMAEFHLMRRNMPEALAFAKKAIQSLPKDSPEHIKAQDIIDTAKRTR